MFIPKRNILPIRMPTRPTTPVTGPGQINPMAGLPGGPDFGGIRPSIDPGFGLPPGAPTGVPRQATQPLQPQRPGLLAIGGMGGMPLPRPGVGMGQPTAGGSPLLPPGVDFAHMNEVNVPYVPPPVSPGAPFTPAMAMKKGGRVHAKAHKKSGHAPRHASEKAHAGWCKVRTGETGKKKGGGCW